MSEKKMNLGLVEVEDTSLEDDKPLNSHCMDLANQINFIKDFYMEEDDIGHFEADQYVKTGTFKNQKYQITIKPL